MAKIIHTGGPAFPLAIDKQVLHDGMTLRDYFAAKAMQGLLLDDNGDFSDRDWLAEKAYAFADAMLEVRKS
jgi:hypothetical protein